MAGIERFGRDLRNALHRTGDGDAGGGGVVQALEQVGVDPPVGRILHHADLLTDDAALLVHALLREVGDGDEREQDLQILLKVLRAVEVIGGRRVGGEGVRLRAVLAQLLQGVAVLGVEHLVLQIVRDASGRIVPHAVEPEAHIHAAVARGEKGVALAVEGFGHNGDGQSVRQRGPQHRFADAGIIRFVPLHCAAPSFPVRK